MEGKMRVSIVATALDNQGPQIKPVVSMVHRLHKRNNGYEEKSVSETFVASNQAILNATDGATALDMTVAAEENKVTEPKNEIKENNFENVSLESANYLQNMESIKDDDIPNFEVDSIELATPDLFSNNDEAVIPNKEINQETELEMFENPDSKENLETKEPEMFENPDSKENLETKEPEMFENPDSEEDFEIPAFLRRQKN
jgi:hypothetical protein